MADMELTSHNKHIKNISRCGTILTENQLEAGRRSLIQPNLQERFPYNQVERKKKKVIQTRPAHLEGICEEEKVDMGRPSPWEAPLPAGRSAGTSGGT